MSTPSKDERFEMELLLELPFKHKGVMCAPFIRSVSLAKYLECGQIEQVVCGGENYDGARPCNYDWVKQLRRECEQYNVSFTFIETGTKFIKDRKLYTLPNKRLQSEMAYKSGISFHGKEMLFKLTDSYGMEIPKDFLYKPYFRERCSTCGSRPICNGCSDCGKCNQERIAVNTKSQVKPASRRHCRHLQHFLEKIKSRFFNAT